VIPDGVENMDIWRVLSVILRRWYIVIPLLVATVVAAVTIGSWVRPEYKASAIISVVADKVTGQSQAAQQQAVLAQVINPYLSVSYTSGVLQYALSSSSVQQEMLAAGLTGGYVVKAIPRSSFLGIDVTASDPQLAIATGRGVITQARLILKKRQSSIAPPTRRVTIDIIDDSDTASTSVSGHLQAQAAVLAVGVIVSVIVTVLINDLLLLRRSRRERKASEDAASSSQEADEEATSSSNGVASSTVETIASGKRVDS
jgi:capsular polysaccharide biosynthesis protein